MAYTSSVFFFQLLPVSGTGTCQSSLLLTPLFCFFSFYSNYPCDTIGQKFSEIWEEKNLTRPVKLFGYYTISFDLQRVPPVLTIQR